LGQVAASAEELELGRPQEASNLVERRQLGTKVGKRLLVALRNGSGQRLEPASRTRPLCLPRADVQPQMICPGAATQQPGTRRPQLLLVDDRAERAGWVERDRACAHFLQQRQPVLAARAAGADLGA